MRFVDATFSLFLEFLRSLHEQDLQPSTIANYARGVDVNRVSSGLLPFKELEPGLWASFMRGLAKLRPSHSKYIGLIPFSPRDLLKVLLDRLATRSDDFNVRRDLTLFLLRCECVMRAGEAMTVRRSTIRSAKTPAHAPCVVFNYTTKSSSASLVATDSNYCACICDLQGGRTICPACNLLRLRRTVDSLPLASTHDSVFTDVNGRALSRDRVRTIITALMRSAQLPSVMTAHSLRHAVNQALQLGGVDEAAIALRAGWSTAASNATQRANYTHHRFVRHVFSKVLFLNDGIFH